VYPQPRDRPELPCPTSSNPLPTVARIVIFGAGPPGWKPHRASARGHEVVCSRPATAPAQLPFDGAHKKRRAEMMQIVDCARCTMRSWRRWTCGYNLYAEAADVLAEKP